MPAVSVSYSLPTQWVQLLGHSQLYDPRAGLNLGLDDAGLVMHGHEQSLPAALLLGNTRLDSLPTQILSTPTSVAALLAEWTSQTRLVNSLPCQQLLSATRNAELPTTWSGQPLALAQFPIEWAQPVSGVLLGDVRIAAELGGAWTAQSQLAGQTSVSAPALAGAVSSVNNLLGSQSVQSRLGGRAFIYQSTI